MTRHNIVRRTTFYLLVALLLAGGTAWPGAPLGASSPVVSDAGWQARGLDAGNGGGSSATASQSSPTFDLSLTPGWNLVSLPADPIDRSIDSVFGGATSVEEIVTSQDASGAADLHCNPLNPGSLGASCVVATRSGTGPLAGTLTTVQAGLGYWVRSTAVESVRVDLGGQGGSFTLPFTRPLREGFNLVGVTSTDESANAGDAFPADEYFSGLAWEKAHEFDANTQSFSVLTPGTGAQVRLGEGYYVYLSDPGVLLPAPTSPTTIRSGATIVGGQATVPIVPGWNLVSLPGPPTDTRLSSILTPSVPIRVIVGYNPTRPGGFLTAVRDASGQWAGTLTTLEEGFGYWMRATMLFSLTVDVRPPSFALAPPVVDGWNLLGVTVTDPAELQDLDGDGQSAELPLSSYLLGLEWLVVVSFDPFTASWEVVRTGSPVSAQNVKIGTGYWVYLSVPEAPVETLPPNSAVISDDAALSDSITYALTGVPFPLAGTEYVGWLVSDDGSIKLSTGPMVVGADGSLNHTFDRNTQRYTGENLIHAYDKVVITVEVAGSDPDAPAGFPVYIHQIPQGGMAHIRHLLTSWPPGEPKGILTNLKEQLDVAILYANLAVDSNTLAQVKQHTERVVNTIEGEGGPNFGDLDGNGSIENPGDLIGVLIHASDRKHAAFSAGSAPDDPVITAHAVQVEDTGKNAADWSTQARDDSLNVFAQTDIATAKAFLGPGAGTVIGLLNAARNGLDADQDGVVEPIVGEGGAEQAYVQAQRMATYSLPPPEIPEPDLTPTPIPGYGWWGLAMLGAMAGVVLLLRLKLNVRRQDP